MVKPETKRWTDLVMSFLAIRLLLWVAVVVYQAPGWLVNPWNLMEYMDDHQHHGLDVVGRITYLKYHQFPLWNPYWCGGTFGIAEPETIYLAPDFIIRSLLWGPERGRHIVLVVMTIVGIEGTFRLARRFDCSAVGATFAAILYGTQYIFLGFVHDGAMNFLTGFELIPWALLCFYEGMDSLPWRLLGGFVTAWIFLCAGTYPTPFTLWVLLVVGIATSVAYWFGGEKGRWLAPWKTLTTMGIVAFLLACAKLFPLISFLMQFKRTWLVIENHPAQALLTELTGHYPWLFVFAFVSILFADRKAAFFVGVAGLFFTMAMGDFDPLSPYHVLKALPLMGQLRNPERYLLLVILFLALAAGRGITRVEDTVPTVLRRLFRGEPVPRGLHAAMVGACAVAAAAFVYPRTKQILTEHTVTTDLFTFDAPRKADEPFRQVRGNRRDPHVFNYANVGTLLCITGIVIPQSPELRADLPAEEYPLDPNSATVQRVKWTPNAIDLHVVAWRGTRVIINQNWNKHFKSTVGRVVNHKGLLAIDVPAGTHDLRVAYRDRVFDVCIVISGLTLLGLVIYAAWFVRVRVAAAIRRFRALPWLPPEGPNVV